MSPDEIKKHIIADLSLEALSPEQQDRIITELSETILERITIAAMAKVPEEQLAQLDALAQEGKQEELAQKLAQLVPNLAEMAQQITQEGIDEYKRLLAQFEAEEKVTPTGDAVPSQPSASPAAAMPAQPAPPVATPSAAAPSSAASAAPVPATDSSVAADIDDPAAAAAAAAKLPPRDTAGVIEENLVVGDDGEAQPADSPLINPSPTPDQPAY